MSALTFAKMNTSHRKTIGVGLLALLGGLVAGGWLGYILRGGSSDSFSGALELTTAFLILSPFLLFSIFTIMRDDSQMQILLRVCIGVIFITTSWILAHKSGRGWLQIGTFLGALIYNTAAGITVFEALSA
jgi:cation transport ATPase